MQKWAKDLNEHFSREVMEVAVCVCTRVHVCVCARARVCVRVCMCEQSHSGSERGDLLRQPHMRRCSTALITREVQIKTVTGNRYIHFTSTRMARSKEQKKGASVGESEEIRSLIHGL